MAQAQTYDSNSRFGQLKKGSESASPEVLANPLIQGLKSQLTQAENKLKDVSQHLGRNHPSYQAAEAEVNNLRSTIAAETSKTSHSVGQTARVSQQKEAEIKAALALQKAHVLKFKAERDEMAVLMREAEGAQRIYDNALQRFGQTNMESKSVQTDVAILNPAIAPIKHSSPRITINILISIVLGALLAVGVALVAEMLERRIRTTEDLRKLIDVPVLADINKSAKKPITLLSKLRQVIKKNKLENHLSTDLKLIVK
jgi:uncharacterized protein involved in exopolysaccharide biosynthesis